MLYQAVVKELVVLLNVGLVVSLYIVYKIAVLRHVKRYKAVYSLTSHSQAKFIRKP